MVIFKSKQIKIDLKIKLCVKRLCLTESIKHLSMKIVTNLSWQYLLSDLSIKPNSVNALLFKMRKYDSFKALRSIYFSIFNYLPYCSIIWTQNCSTIQRILILRKKAVRVIDIQPRNSHTKALFKKSSILKFQDKICLENILFPGKSLNDLSSSVFNTWFSFSSDQHNYETSSSTKGNLLKLFYKTNRYGKYSITFSAVELRNKIQKQVYKYTLDNIFKLSLIIVVAVVFYLCFSLTFSAAELRNKIQKQLKIWYLKIYRPIRLKLLSVILI